MKKLILASIALLLVFAVAPAMAVDKSNYSSEPAAFQALSNLSAPGQTALNTMTDEQLAAVEGQRKFVFIKKNSNKSFIYQSNKCVACAFVYQSNYANVNQKND